MLTICVSVPRESLFVNVTRLPSRFQRSLCAWWWCAWYSEEGYGRKHQESIRESYYDRDSNDMHAGICANPQKGARCMNRMIDLSD